MHLLDSVRDFYSVALGLHEGPRPPFKFAGYWLYAGTHPVLHLTAARENQACDSRSASIDHIAFACHDYEATCQTLKSLGIDYRTNTVPGLEQTQVFSVIRLAMELNSTLVRVPSALKAFTASHPY